MFQYHKYANLIKRQKCTKSWRRNIARVKGTQDVFGKEAEKFFYVTDSARKIAQNYGFKQIATPLIEEVSLFCRSLGNDSEVVSKEMYLLQDKGTRETLALRPENTAGVIRALLSNSIHCSAMEPVQVFYAGPMFRYERPQRGRLRQFHQIGVEAIGDNYVFSDITVISLAAHMLRTWDLLSLTQLEINTLGDASSQETYRAVLKEYLQRKKTSLSLTSRQRLERGSVLRILDSKEAEDQPVIEDAPTITEYLNNESSRRWKEILQGLESVGINYVLNPRLVRGLDYYDHTIFEFTTRHASENAEESPKLTVLGGGRYNGLVKVLSEGKKSIPAVGWSAGVERLINLLPSTHAIGQLRYVAVIPVGTTYEITEGAFKLCSLLRENGIPSLFITSEANKDDRPVQLGKLLRVANKRECRFAIFLGGEELASGIINVKDLDNEKVHLLPKSSALEFLKTSFRSDISQ